MVPKLPTAVNGRSNLREQEQPGQGRHEVKRHAVQSGQGGDQSEQPPPKRYVTANAFWAMLREGDTGSVVSPPLPSVNGAPVAEATGVFRSKKILISP